MEGEKGLCRVKSGYIGFRVSGEAQAPHIILIRGDSQKGPSVGNTPLVSPKP